MSGKVNVGLKVRPLPKLELRATNAGELIANMMPGAEPELAIAQQGFQRGLFQRVVIYGTDHAGRAIDHAAFAVADEDNDLVSVDADDTISMVQRTDRGAAEAVSRCYARFLALGLSPVARFSYHPKIANDPALRAKYNAELGLVDREPIELADGYVVDLVKITPAKDRGQCFEFGRGRKAR